MISKIRIFSILLVAAFFSAPLLANDASFEDPNLQLTVSVPEALSILPDQTAPVIVAMKHTNGFPTFNIIPEALEPSESTNRDFLLKKVLDSYQLIGITDISAKRTDVFNLDGNPVFLAVLSYNLSDIQLRSTVIIVPGQEENLILTYIDRESDFKSNRHILNELLSSFHWKKARNCSECEYQQTFLNRYWTHLVIGVVILGVLLIFLVQKGGAKNALK